MIEVKLLKICKKCGDISKIEKIYIDDKTSEEEYFVKEYICHKCNYKFLDKEYINYVLK